MKLQAKTAIVTGAGSGIGRACATLFAAKGAKVIVADIDSRKGQRTAEKITKQGGQAVFIKVDTTCVLDVKEMINFAVRNYGKLDIILNNVGMLQELKPIEEITEKEWEHIFDVNVKSVFLGVKYALPELKKTGSGVIINTSSISGLRPRPHNAGYTTTKGAVIMLTKALAIELAPFNIRANCICPILTDTPLLDIYSAETKKNFMSTIPLGRIAKPEDIAYAALYLASDDSAMVTGVALNVDGGRGI